MGGKAGRGGTGKKRAEFHARELAERVKELNCLYSISRLFEAREQELDDVLSTAVELIPDAWQHPDVAAARITLAGKEFSTPGYADSQWMQTTPIVVNGTRAGRLDVIYLEERGEQDEGPFLTEERRLLNVLAQRIGEVTERKQAEAQLRLYRQRLRSLAVALTRSEEMGRREFARELHDGIGQQLALIQIKLGILQEEAVSEGTRVRVGEVRELVSQAIRQTRTLTFEISPPVLYERGLDEALAWLADQASKQYGLQVKFECDGPRPGLSDELRASLYRAAAELLANVGRHSLATQAELWLRNEGGRTRLSVVDNGIGFDVAGTWQRIVNNGSFGLFSITERLEELGGEVTIDSEPGRGTRVTVAVPVGPVTRDEPGSKGGP